jgi:hypothetical protein
MGIIASWRRGIAGCVPVPAETGRRAGVAQPIVAIAGRAIQMDRASIGIMHAFVRKNHALFDSFFAPFAVRCVENSLHAVSGTVSSVLDGCLLVRFFPIRRVHSRLNQGPDADGFTGAEVPDPCNLWRSK